MQPTYIKTTSVVLTQNIGEGTTIWNFCTVMRDVIIGTNCNIGDHCFIESGAIIGNNVTIKNGCKIWDGVVIHDDVFIGPNSTFTNDLFPRSPRLDIVQEKYKNKSWLQKTIVHKGSSLGASVTILPGLEIGEFSMIGAGAVVTQYVNPFTIVTGNPARFIGHICRCGKPISTKESKYKCSECKSELEFNDKGILVLDTKKDT